MPKKKILVADDSKTALMMNQMILKRRPYEVVTAADGREAVAKALKEQPDLILMDVVMPEMDGFQAVQTIRAMEPTKGIPIIMVTTRSEAGNVERGFALGCNDYVYKPVNAAELLAKIKNLIGE